MKQVLDMTTDMMALIDRDFVYIYTNKAYAKAFLKKSKDFIGNTVSDVFGEMFFKTIIEPNALKCLKNNNIKYKNWFKFPAFKKEKYMEINYYPYIINNTVTGFVVNAREELPGDQLKRLRQLTEKLENKEQKDL